MGQIHLLKSYTLDTRGTILAFPLPHKLELVCEDKVILRSTVVVKKLACLYIKCVDSMLCMCVLPSLSHFRYSTEVDVDFVRKSVRAIGRCAIKVESAAERCVGTLVDLIQTKVTYVVQEAVVVIKDIFRKYPNQYESIISTLCENLDSLDEPEARYCSPLHVVYFCSLRQTYGLFSVAW